MDVDVDVDVDVDDARDQSVRGAGGGAKSTMSRRAQDTYSCRVDYEAQHGGAFSLLQGLGWYEEERMSSSVN